METIGLAHLTGPTIDLRETVSRILNDIAIKKTPRIVLDFTDITFLSRAAADQLLKEIDRLNKGNVDVSFVNMEPDIGKMLNQVSKSAHQIKSSDTQILEISQSSKVISVLSRFFHRATAG
jgi:anti-anti-sigma regulatory factor